MAGRARLMPAEVGVVVLAFDAPAGVLEECVASVISQSPAGTRTVVIDNGNEARSRLMHSLGDRIASISIVEAASNRGYGSGMNLGMRTLFEQQCQVVVLLNDDVTVSSGWLEPLLDPFASADVAAVQPLLLQHTEGDGQVVVNSAGVDIDEFGAGSDRYGGIAVDTALAELGHAAADLEIFTGGAVALHRDAIASVGGFDERFFLYYEDVELARRLGRAGWSSRLVTQSRVTHRGSATASALGDRARWLQERNRLWASAMHGSTRETAQAIWLSIRRLRHEPRGVHRRALIAGLAGMPRRSFDRLRKRPASDTQDLVKVCR